MKNKKDLLEIYKNYLYSIHIREEYGDKYGDTDELIEFYEEELSNYQLKKSKKEGIKKYKNF